MTVQRAAGGPCVWAFAWEQLGTERAHQCHLTLSKPLLGQTWLAGALNVTLDFSVKPGV